MCLTAPVDTLIRPCRHMCLCEPCMHLSPAGEGQRVGFPVLAAPVSVSSSASVLRFCFLAARIIVTPWKGMKGGAADHHMTKSGTARISPAFAGVRAAGTCVCFLHARIILTLWTGRKEFALTDHHRTTLSGIARTSPRVPRRACCRYVRRSRACPLCRAPLLACVTEALCP